MGADELEMGLIPKATLGADLKQTFVDPWTPGCQIASNRDPSFASNNDPSWVTGLGLST